MPNHENNFSSEAAKPAAEKAGWIYPIVYNAELDAAPGLTSPPNLNPHAQLEAEIARWQAEGKATPVASEVIDDIFGKPPQHS